jgi:hypothetical protein
LAAKAGDAEAAIAEATISARSEMAIENRNMLILRVMKGRK